MCEEDYIAAQFGIPQVVWSVAKGITPRGMVRTDEQIKSIYTRLDLKAMRKRAELCLKEFKRSVDFPLLTSDHCKKHVSRRYSYLVAACNLIPDVMQVPVPLDKWVGLKTFAWQTISEVPTKRHSDWVYSMDVEKYAHYIADGIVTHNCLYGWLPAEVADFGGAAGEWHAWQGLPVQFAMPHPEGYSEAYEPVLYGWKVGAAHRWFSDRKQTTVLDFDRPSRSEAHPTMKPVPLITYLMRNSSRPGELVLDTFLGSGTTMYAAELCQRVCYGTELEPKFCSVILERMVSAGCVVSKL